MIKKAKSKIHGYGVFATRPIGKNTKICQYVGEKIDNKEFKRREKIHTKKGELWLFEISWKWYIDASVGGGIAKFVNHSKTPNCYTHIKNHEIWYRAARNIKKGEELTVDYCTELPDLNGNK